MSFLAFVVASKAIFQFPPMPFLPYYSMPPISIKYKI
jgi:hypothetical protein